MIPIYEQNRGRALGHTAKSFAQRFTQLCDEHLREGRADAFAFIFYDFLDRDLRTLLQDPGVFTELDRLIGKSLSVFFLHDGGKRSIERFNERFISELEIADKVTLPCIVFFKFENQQIGDVVVVPLESATLKHGLHEMYGVIRRYMDTELAAEPSRPKSSHWLKSGGKFIGVELFRAMLREVFPHLM